MNTKLFLIAVGLLSLHFCFPAQAQREPQVKIDTEAFDVAEEAVAYVEALLQADQEIAAQYQKLTAATQEEAGGRYSTSKFDSILWTVPEFQVEYTDTGGVEDGEYVYLIRQQLVAGYRRGYAITANVVAQVHAKQHKDFIPTGKGDEFKLAKATLTLRFEGFVKLDPEPLFSKKAP